MIKKLDRSTFQALMQRLSQAWAQQDTEAALTCFAQDAVYMQPPDVQFYRGHQQLRAYFGALRPGVFLEYQNIWFDESRQTGCVEFSFGNRANPQADHGCIVVEVEDGLIAHWREYVQKGPADFGEFTATEGKQWQWHIGNYP